MSISRDVTLLHPVLQEKVAALRELCKNGGFVLGIADTLRTAAEQDRLYAQGRTAPGTIVTGARGSNFGSMHQWGLAFDFFQNISGKAYDDSQGFFFKVGQLGKSAGLFWGGDFTKADHPHFELRDFSATAAQLRNKYGTPEAYFKTWPGASSSPAAQPAKPSWRRVMRRQNPPMQGQDVRDLQTALIKAGFQLPKWGADGFFGAETETAVLAFQREYARPVDGIVGPITWMALERWL